MEKKPWSGAAVYLECFGDVGVTAGQQWRKSAGVYAVLSVLHAVSAGGRVSDAVAAAFGRRRGRRRDAGLSLTDVRRGRRTAGRGRLRRQPVLRSLRLGRRVLRSQRRMRRRRRRPGHRRDSRVGWSSRVQRLPVERRADLRPAQLAADRRRRQRGRVVRRTAAGAVLSTRSRPPASRRPADTGTASGVVGGRQETVTHLRQTADVVRSCRTARRHPTAVDRHPTHRGIATALAHSTTIITTTARYKILEFLLSFTSSRTKDLCRKWKVKLLF